jgi:protein TonB
MFGNTDANPSQPGGSGSGADVVGHGARPSPVIVISEPPTPEPVRKLPVISKGVITSEALSLPKPPYPEMAKLMRLQGKVTIQVLIDESGKVISVRVLDGHPMFKQVSERAAYQARFSPTRLGDQPVKVSGVISYNFVLQ